MEELKEINSKLQKNLEYTKEVHEMVIKIRRYIIFQQIMSIVKIVLIVVPLLIGFFFALPFFRQAFDAYKEMFGAFDSVNGGASKDSGLLDVISQIKDGSISEKDLQQFIR